jgi:hypothetical protein
MASIMFYMALHDQHVIRKRKRRKIKKEKIKVNWHQTIPNYHTCATQEGK